MNLSKICLGRAGEYPGAPTLALVLVLVVAFLVRLVYLVQISSYPNFQVPYPGLDAALYHDLAQRIATGDWRLGPEVYYFSATYAYFLGFLYALFGDGPWVARMANVVLGVGTVALIFHYVRRFFQSPAAALVAAVGAALYGPYLVSDTTGLKTSWGLFLTALSLTLIGSSERKGGFWSWLFIGLVLGLALNLSGQLAVFLVGICLWLLLRKPPAHPEASGQANSSPPRRRLASVGGMILGVILALAPFGIRNYLVARNLVFLPADGGIHFYIGNHLGAWGGYSAVPGIRPNPTGHFHDARRVAEEQAGRALSAAQVDAYWKAQALSFIRNHPGQFLKLLKDKVLLLASPYEIPNNENYQYLVRRSSFLASFLRLGILMPLGLAGFCLSFCRSRNLVPLQIFFVSYVLGVVLSFVTWRYRLPLTLALWPFAAFLAVTFFQEIQARKVKALLAGTVLIFSFYLLGRLAPLGPRISQTDLWMAERNMKVCRLEAQLHNQMASHPLRSDPARGMLWYRLFQLRSRQGDLEGGIRVLRQALRENPDQPRLREAMDEACRRNGIEPAGNLSKGFEW